MFQGTMIDELIEIVMKVEEHAHVEQLVEPRSRDGYDNFLYELPQSSAALIGVA